MNAQDFILGGGVTGLAASMASGLPVFEAEVGPGGICSSYYMRPHTSERLAEAPADGNAYRFELGGGHWIFGGEPAVLERLEALAPVRSYERISSVCLADGTNIPFPLQNHLRFLPAAAAQAAFAEIAQPKPSGATMRAWLEGNFGPTLCGLFFFPFHERYTAGLYHTIAPQDAYKSPLSLRQVQEGLSGQASASGYNVRFLYPQDGLNALAAGMAARGRVVYGKRAVRIDVAAREVFFEDGSARPYRTLLCTLPLNKTMEMAGLRAETPADPYTSVLVLNIGARKGPRCPRDHWLYFAESGADFHRAGFYSNVDPSFLPAPVRADGTRTSLYIERAYAGGARPSRSETAAYADAAVRRLQALGYIEDVDVLDPTWIEVAYTWQRPGSAWREQALAALAAHGIRPVGRYANWKFQGIADSIRDGLRAGEALKR